MLHQVEIDYYHSNGYIAVENVLSVEEIADLQRVTDEFVEKSREVAAHDDVFDLEPGHSSQAPRVRRIKNAAIHHSVYDRTLRNDRILDIVEQLIGPGVSHNGHKLNMKYPKFGSPVEWHQDWAFYPHTNDRLLAVGVAIDDMLFENGCLMVIPKSHKGRIFNHHQNGAFVGAVTDANFEPNNAVPIEVKSGGISIHHVRTLHGSAQNVSDKPRRLLLLQYCAVDAWPLVKPPDWHDFAALVLRGKTTNQPHMAAVPVRMPFPQGARTGTIYEVQSLLEQRIFRMNKPGEGGAAG